MPPLKGLPRSGPGPHPALFLGLQMWTEFLTTQRDLGRREGKFPLWGSHFTCQKVPESPCPRPSAPMTPSLPIWAAWC